MPIRTTPVYGATYTRVTGALFACMFDILQLSSLTLHIQLLLINRWDMTKMEDDFVARTLENMNASLSSRNPQGVQYPPLLNIPISNIILDELHLLLRVFDVLLRNLIHMCVWTERVKKTSSLSTLVEYIRACGVTFNIWQDKDGKGNTSGLL